MKNFSNKVAKFYDDKMYQLHSMEYYGGSAFHNFGFWDENTKNQREASENLFEKLLSLFPEKNGKILDVACGMGESTKCLTKYFVPTNITAINISPRQIDTSKKRAPNIEILKMDAANLTFEDSSFENILCIEACFNFLTRKDFLNHAFRVLKPGGSIVLSDIFVKKSYMKSECIPEENIVKNVEAYKKVYEEIGFQNIQIIDATKECWLGFHKGIKDEIKKRYSQHESTFLAKTIVLFFHNLRISSVKKYLLVHAIKPK